MLPNQIYRSSLQAQTALRINYTDSFQRFFSSAKRLVKNDIVVIGAGCVGQGITASFLSSNKNNRVFLIPSARTMRKIQEHGISIQGAVENTFRPGAHFIVENNLKKETLLKYTIVNNPIVFLTTKSYDAVSSLATIQDLLRPPYKPSIICLQNGLGTEETIKTAIKPFKVPVLKGHVISALHQRSNAIFAYKGDLLIQQHDASSSILKAIVGDQDNSLFNLKISTNIMHAIYPKLTVNCVCNPLTVIFNQTLGSLRTDYEPLIRIICHEVYEVATAQGFYFESSDYLVKIVLEAMEKFSEHHSSMYLDIMAGKKTEIDQINGAIVSIASAKSIITPLNQLLTIAIKDIELLRLTCSSLEEFYKEHAAYLSELQAQLLSCTLINRTSLKIR